MKTIKPKTIVLGQQIIYVPERGDPDCICGHGAGSHYQYLGSALTSAGKAAFHPCRAWDCECFAYRPRTREQDWPVAERLAARFHEAYERLAPEHSYETRQESAKPWADVPENNRNLMIAVVADLLTRGIIKAP